MAFEALRGYVQLANGLTDVTRQRAQQVAKALLDQGGDVVDLAVSTAVSGSVARQAQSLAEELMATSRTNRDLLIGLIRTEVERAVARLGLVGSDELAAMTRLVERLQSQLDAAIAFGGDLIPTGRETATTAPAPGPDVDPDAKNGPEAAGTGSARQEGDKVPVKKVPVKKAARKKVPVKKADANKATGPQ